MDNNNFKTLVDENQKKRFKFLYKLYELTKGSMLKSISRSKITDELGYENYEIQSIIQYFVAEALTVGFDHIYITNQGINEIETILSEKPTPHFPNVQIIPIIKDSPGASISLILSQDKIQQYNQAIQYMRDHRDELEIELEPNSKERLIRDINTIEEQIASPQPEPGIIDTAKNSMIRILEGAAGSAIVATAIEILKVL